MSSNRAVLRPHTHVPETGRSIARRKPKYLRTSADPRMALIVHPAQMPDHDAPELTVSHRPASIVDHFNENMRLDDMEIFRCSRARECKQAEL
jgi:hypothetical protein